MHKIVEYLLDLRKRSAHNHYTNCMKAAARLSPPVLVAAVFLLAAFCSSSVNAQNSGFYKDYVIVNGTYYNLMGGTGTNFQNHDFGMFDPSAGQTLTLNGFEANVFQHNGDNVYQTFGYYAVTPQGTTANSFSNQQIGFNNAAYDGNKQFNNTSFNVNLLSGLSNGTYTLTVYEFANASYNNGANNFTLYDNQGGANYTATFTVIPEPSTYLAGVLAVSVLAYSQRRRLARNFAS